MSTPSSFPLVPVVLSGGAGTRLWPLSTEELPKQFLRIWPNEKSLFQQTLERVSVPEFLPPVVVCNRSQADLVRADAARAGVALGALVLEPTRRDSAAAIAAAAAFVEDRHGPDAVIAILPSDHLIAPPDRFRAALLEAAARSRGGFLMTFGIAPTRAATEYGYIEQGQPLAGETGAFEVLRFHEKPEAALAAQYVEAGRFYWNSGMFVFPAGVFREEARSLMPDIDAAAETAVRRAVVRGDAVELDETAFASAQRTSIDYALLEKSNRVAVLPAHFEWSDVGNWNSVHEVMQAGDARNYIHGDAVGLDCTSSLVLSEGIPVRILGVEGLCVVATKTGVLVTRLDRAADIKQALET